MRHGLLVLGVLLTGCGPAPVAMPTRVLVVTSPSPVVTVSPSPVPVDDVLPVATARDPETGPDRYGQYPVGARWGCAPVHVVVTDDRFLRPLADLAATTGLTFVLDAAPAHPGDAVDPAPDHLDTLAGSYLDGSVVGHRHPPLVVRTWPRAYVFPVAQTDSHGSPVLVSGSVGVPPTATDADVRHALAQAFGVDVDEGLFADGYPPAAFVDHGAASCPQTPPHDPPALPGDPRELAVPLPAVAETAGHTVAAALARRT